MLQHTPRAIIDEPPSLMIVPPVVIVVVVILFALVVAIAGITAVESLEQLAMRLTAKNSITAEIREDNVFIDTVKIKIFI